MNTRNWSDIESAAKDMANNHRRTSDFAWFDRPPDGDHWTLVYTHHRDSGLLDQSNAHVIGATLEP
jgi:hypothetical protein